MPVLPEGVTDADDLPDVQRMKYEDALLEALEPAPDEDGDPRTIEGVLPDGREGVISIQTSKPELLEGIDVDELVERDTNDE